MSVSRGWADRVQASSGHVPDDPYCTMYRGDFAGVRLDAKCLRCLQDPPDEVLQWMHPDVTGEPYSDPACTRRHWVLRDLLGLLLLIAGLLLGVWLAARWWL